MSGFHSKICKCQHHKDKHKDVISKAVKCSPEICYWRWNSSMHRCHDEIIYKGYGKCLVDGCSCKSMRPESRIEKQAREQAVSK